MKKRIVMSLIGLLILPMTLSAQDLSDDELALLERVAAFYQSSDAYDSYTTTSEETEIQVVQAITADGTVILEQSSETNKVQGAQLIRTGDDVNLLGESVYVVTESADGEVIEFTLTAEVRYVDGTLYANAAYTEGEGYAIYPDGWAVVDDSYDFFGYEELEIDDILDLIEPRADNPLENVEVLQRVTVDVSSEDTMDDNGDPLQKITLSLDPADIYRELAQADPDFDANDPFVAELINQISEDGTAVIILYLYDDGTPWRLESTLDLLAEEISTPELGLPDGVTITASILITDSQTFSDLNNPELVPAEAPDVN